MKDKSLQLFETEKFKEIELDGKLQLRYAISNFGRLISFTNQFEDGRILKGSLTEGYRIFRYKVRKGDKIVHKHKLLYKLVAEHFLEKTSEEQTCVVHLDHNLANDTVENLKWMTKEERSLHLQTNLKVQRAKVRTTMRLIHYNKKNHISKLTTTQVMLIKKLLAKPNRKTRMKMIAKQFGISEMQLYRIKTGENWGHIQI